MKTSPAQFLKVSITKLFTPSTLPFSATGDFGKLTGTVNGTSLSRAELQISPDTKRFGIAGELIPGGFSLTGSLPWHRANFSLFYNGPADTWLQGLDIAR